jgi:hypothetical protein
MKKVSKVVAALAGLTVVIATSAASATTWYIQAASGRPWNGTQVTNDAYNDDRTSLLDTRVCAAINWVSAVWVTDVPITSTNTTYDGEQNRSWAGDPGSKVESRLVSFNSNGTVYSASSATTNVALNSVSVPSNGSLFVQSTLVKDFDFNIPVYACLYSVKVWN